MRASHSPTLRGVECALASAVKILVSTRHAEALGGAETYLRTIVPALATRGHEIRVAVEMPSAHPENDWVRPLGLEARSLLDEKDVAAEVRDFEPDAIFNHQVANFAIEQALVATKRAVLFMHSYHGLCISDRRMHLFPSPTPCERAFGPVCLALYLPRRCGGLDPVKAVQLYALQAKRLAQLPGYRRVIVPSDHVRRLLLLGKLEDAKIAVVPHFVPRSPGLSVGRLAWPDPIVLAFVGRLTEEKGCLVLPGAVREAARLTGRRLRLEIAGDGPLRTQLRRRLVAAQVEFEFHGWVDESRRDALLSRAGLLLFPSVWLEPFGLVGIEAASHGVPAVAFPHGGVMEWLIAGETGELAEGGTPTPEKFGRAIARAISTPEHLERLARGAYDLSSRFQHEQHVHRIEAALSP